MTIKFNGGNGAILCENCRKILFTFSNIPGQYKRYIEQYFNGEKSAAELPKLYCDECNQQYNERYQ